MGLTYDGITYRSLEEQVRYDAEQVQLLKQADVTINENLQTVNENLQTVNTELNGKLTKPTNPSAESAVTMLADGTVGTKLLSEFGGGKLYLHSTTIYTTDAEPVAYSFTWFSNDDTTCNTLELLKSKYKDKDMVRGSVLVNQNSYPLLYVGFFITDGVSKLSISYQSVYGTDENHYYISSDIGYMNDTVTEL